MSGMAPEDHKSPSLLVKAMAAMTAVILLVFSFHAVYVYSSQRAEIIKGMNRDIRESLERLSKNIEPFMAAYSINEYEKLVATEIALKQHFAVVVEDAAMGEIIGDPYYVSGQIRGPDGNYIPYRKDNPLLNERLDQAFLSGTTAIIGRNGEERGRVSVYVSDAPLIKKLHVVLVEELLTVLILTVTLSLLMAVVLRRYFFGPLRRISASMKNCDGDGIPLAPLPDPRYRVSVHSTTFCRPAEIRPTVTSHFPA